MRESSRLNGLHHILRPIVRYMLGGAHSIQDFIEVLKRVYIEVATEQIEKTGEDANASRLVMATGIHRIEVNRILEEAVEPPRSDGNMLFRIIGQWEQDRKFRNADGTPKVLSFKGKNSQFAKLLRSISLCLVPGTVLFELERIGAVERTEEGLKLVSDFESSSEDSAEVYHIISNDLGDLMTCFQENLQWKKKRRKGAAGNLHLRTEYDNILVEEIPQIREWLVKEGKNLHRKAREYIAQFDKDVVDRKGSGGGKVILQAFSLTSPSGIELQESKAAKPRAQAASSPKK